MSARTAAEGPLFHSKPNTEQQDARQDKQRRAAGQAPVDSRSAADQRRPIEGDVSDNDRPVGEESPAPTGRRLQMDLMELWWPASESTAGCRSNNNESKTNHFASLYANKPPKAQLAPSEPTLTARSLSARARVTPPSGRQPPNGAYRVRPSAPKSSPPASPPGLFVLLAGGRQWARARSYKRHPKSSSPKPRGRRQKQLQCAAKVSIYLLMKQAATLMDWRPRHNLSLLSDLRLPGKWLSSIADAPCSLGLRRNHPKMSHTVATADLTGPQLAKAESSRRWAAAILVNLHCSSLESRRVESTITPSKIAPISQPPPTLSPHLRRRPRLKGCLSFRLPLNDPARRICKSANHFISSPTGPLIRRQLYQGRHQKRVRLTCEQAESAPSCHAAACELQPDRPDLVESKIDLKSKKANNSKSNSMVKFEQILKYKPHVKIKKPCKCKKPMPRFKLSQQNEHQPARVQVQPGCYAQPQASPMIDVSSDVAHPKRQKQPAPRDPFSGEPGRHSCFCQASGKIDKALGGPEPRWHHFGADQTAASLICQDNKHYIVKSKLVLDLAASSRSSQDGLESRTIACSHETWPTVPLASCTRSPSDEWSPKVRLGEVVGEKTLNTGQINKFVKCTKVRAPVQVTSESEMGHILRTINQVSSASNCCWQSCGNASQRPIRSSLLECKLSQCLRPKLVSSEKADPRALPTACPAPNTRGQEVTSRPAPAGAWHAAAGRRGNDCALIYSKRRHHLLAFCLLLLHCLSLTCAHRSSPITAAAAALATSATLRDSFVVEQKATGQHLLDRLRWGAYSQRAADGTLEGDLELDLRRLARRSAANSNSSSDLANVQAQDDSIKALVDQQAELRLSQAKQPVYRWPFIGLVSFMFIGAAGNILVCMAVWRERRLQTATNYFLLSLAVADLLVCTLVMPFGIIYEFYGHWPFDWRICNLYVTCDVLTCSSSILHMCFISVGRYLGIRNPLHARQANLFVSRRAVLWRIAIAWLSSALIASPITMMSIYNHENIIPSPNECAISNKYFLIFGSLLAFFIPMFVMVPSYIMTVRLLSRRAEFVRNNSLLLTNASNYQLQTSKHSNTDYIKDEHDLQTSDNPCPDYCVKSKISAVDSNNNECCEHSTKLREFHIESARSNAAKDLRSTEGPDFRDIKTMHKSPSISRCEVSNVREGVHSSNRTESVNNSSPMALENEPGPFQSASISRQMIKPAGEKSGLVDQNHQNGQPKCKVEFATTSLGRINGARSLEDRLNVDLEDTRYIDDNDPEDDNGVLEDQTHECGLNLSLREHDDQLHHKIVDGHTAVAIGQDMDGWLDRNLERDTVQSRQQGDNKPYHGFCLNTKDAHSTKSITNRSSEVCDDNPPNNNSSFACTAASDRQLLGNGLPVICMEQRSDNGNKPDDEAGDKNGHDLMTYTGNSREERKDTSKQVLVDFCCRGISEKSVTSKSAPLVAGDQTTSQITRAKESDTSSMTCRISLDNDVQSNEQKQQQGISATTAGTVACTSLTAKQMTPRRNNDLNSDWSTRCVVTSAEDAMACRLSGGKEDDILPNLTSVFDESTNSSTRAQTNLGAPKVNLVETDNGSGCTNSAGVSILIVQDTESEHSSSRATDTSSRRQREVHRCSRFDRSSSNSLSSNTGTHKLEGSKRLKSRQLDPSGHHYPLECYCHHGSSKQPKDSASLDDCPSLREQTEQSRHHSHHHRNRCRHHHRHRRQRHHNAQNFNQTKAPQHDHHNHHHHHHHHHRHNHHRHSHGRHCPDHDIVGYLTQDSSGSCSQKRSQRHICSINQKSETEDENHVCSSVNMMLSLPNSNSSLLRTGRTRHCCSPSGSSSFEENSHIGSKKTQVRSLHKSAPHSSKLDSSGDQVEHKAVMPQATSLTLMSSTNGHHQYCGHSKTTISEQQDTPADNNCKQSSEGHQSDNKKTQVNKRRRSNMYAESALGASIMAAAIPILSSVTSKTKGSRSERDVATRTSSSNNSSLGGQSNQQHVGNHQSFHVTSSTDTQNEPQMIRYLGSTSMQVRSEQKATKVLGVVFFTFVICWTPFFVINFTQAFVDRHELVKWISNEMMTTFLWLGYISSTINPVIYTVFNRNFRRAFRQLICCREASHLYNRRARNSEMTKSFRFSHYGRQTQNQSVGPNNANLCHSMGRANRKFSMKNSIASMANSNNVNDHNNVTGHHIGVDGANKLLSGNKGGGTMLMLDDDQSPAIHRQERSSLLSGINNRTLDGNKPERHPSTLEANRVMMTADKNRLSKFARISYQAIRSRIIQASSSLFTLRNLSSNAAGSPSASHDYGYNVDLHENDTTRASMMIAQQSALGGSRSETMGKKTMRPKLSFARVDSDDR